MSFAVAAETATAPAADDSGDRALQELRRRAKASSAELTTPPAPLSAEKVAALRELRPQPLKEADLRDLLRRFEAGVGHEVRINPRRPLSASSRHLGQRGYFSFRSHGWNASTWPRSSDSYAPP
ncbi:Lrrc56, partial [Symbiodinium sp. KB8]